MYVGQLTMAQQLSSERDAASDAINTLLSALRMNGQICGREWPIAITPAGYAATVLLPEKTSLDASHHNRYVRCGLQKLQEAGLAEPDCEVTEDVEGAGVCA
jgi:predicted  nucleic acid-binding Zn ribbon protein